MAKRLALGIALATMADAAFISGKSDSSTSKILFSNLDSTIPKAKASNGQDNAANVLKWEISNLTWMDEDTGLSFMEITSTLTAPILSTDQIKFHVEFESSK